MKTKEKFIVLASVGIILIAAMICSRISSSRVNREESEAVETEIHPRIVSLAPSTTEALFALGLGPNVVGVSQFCDFPPEVTNIVSVGGYGSLDKEAAIRLKPDVVIAPKSNYDAEAVFKEFNIDTLLVEQDTFQQILDSMWIIGEELDRADVAAAWLGTIDRIVTAVKEAAPPPEKAPRVLIVISRLADSLDRIYIAGANNFYDDILKIAGGINAYPGDVPYPIVGPGGIVKMNPDIIIDIAPERNGVKTMTSGEAKKQWSKLAGVKAVDFGRIYVLTKSWAVRPGPRIGFLLDRIANIIHDAAPVEKPADSAKKQ